MPAPSQMSDLSALATSNSPAGSDPIGSTLDDYLRAIQAIVRREQAQGASLASASTVNIGSTTDGAYLHITGTTTINSFGTAPAGISRVVVFDGILTLTHSSSLIMPGALSVLTEAGAVAVFVSEGSGVWRCASMTSSKWATARTIAMTGDLTWSVSTDGSYSTSGAGTLSATGIAAGTYKSLTVDAKGRATSGTNPTTVSGYGITDCSLSATFSASPQFSLRAIDSRTVSNPSAGVGYSLGGRFRFSNMNDTDASAGFADVIDMSTYGDSSGGGINSLYLSKSAQQIIHKFATAGATAWTSRTLAYTDSNITGNAATATTAGYATTAGTALNATSASGLANSPGVAPQFACRAWVEFSGVGSIGTNMTITGGGNVSSVFKNGNGDYTINFTVAMPSAAYGVSVSQQPDTSGGGSAVNIATGLYRDASSKQTGSCRVITAAGGSNNNPSLVTVQVFC